MSFMLALLGTRQRQTEVLAPSTVIPKDEERIPMPLWLTVPDLLVSAYLVLGARQADYFLVYSTLKSALLLVFKYLFLQRVNRQLILLEVCYVANAEWVVYFLLVTTCKSLFPLLAEETNQQAVFKAFYCWFMGPLCNHVWKGCFLSMSDFHYYSTFWLHFAPPLALFLMRWQEGPPSSVLLAGSIAVNELNDADLLYELFVVPTAIYFVTWTIPYYLINFVLCGEAIEKRQLVTVFNSSAFAAPSSSLPLWIKGLVYILVHELVIWTTFLVAQITWRSEIWGTLWFLFLVLAAANNQFSQVLLKNQKR